METYFDSRIDLIQRSLQKHSDRLKMRAEETLETFKIRDLSGDLLAENFDREVRSFKLKVRIEFKRVITRMVDHDESLLGLQAHDAISRVLAICQSRPHS